MKPTSYKVTVKSPNATTYEYFDEMHLVVAFYVTTYAFAKAHGIDVSLTMEPRR
jgi:hypothetical protein